MLTELKKDFIKRLQKHTDWHAVADYKTVAKEQFEKATDQQKQEVKEVFLGAQIAVDRIGVEHYEKLLRPDFLTHLLQDTDNIQAPIVLDLTVELPFVELYVDKGNYCVFTTSRIYSCIGARLEIIDHKNIVDIDDYSLAIATRNQPKDVPIIQFDLKLCDGNKVPILCESGIPLRSLFEFFYFVRDTNKTG